MFQTKMTLIGTGKLNAKLDCNLFSFLPVNARFVVAVVCRVSKLVENECSRHLRLPYRITHRSHYRREFTTALSLQFDRCNRY